MQPWYCLDIVMLAMHLTFTERNSGSCHRREKLSNQWLITKVEHPAAHLMARGDSKALIEN
jgi:hypothetical protein